MNHAMVCRVCANVTGASSLRYRVDAIANCGPSAGQSVSQGFICEIINKRANTCDPTIEEYSSRSSMIWCLRLVWSACAYRVPCLPKLVLLGQRWTKARVSCTSVYAPACPSLQGHPVHCRSRLAMVNWATGPASR